MRHVGWFFLLSCSSGQVPNPQGCVFAPRDEAHGAPAIYVCEGSKSGDGSPTAPFPTISEALEAAPSGATLYVSPGRYSENLEIDTSLAIIGFRDGERHPMIAPQAGPVGILVQAPGDVWLSNLEVAGAHTAGLWIRGTSTHLAGITVTNTQGGSDDLGDGILATEGAQLTLDHVTVQGSARIGLLAVDSQVAAGDCSFMDNLGGGLKAEGGTIDLERISALNNATYGVALIAAEGTLEGATVSGTLEAPAGGQGNGLVIASFSQQSPAEVDVAVLRSQFMANHGSGILVDRLGGVQIVESEVSDNRRVGMLIQRLGDTRSVQLTDNIVERNRLVGVALVQSSPVVMRGNTIRDTQGGSIVNRTIVGDALSIYDTDIDVEGNDVGPSDRLGIIVSAARGRIERNNIRENQLAIVLQDRAAEQVSTAANTFSGAATELVIRPPGEELSIYVETDLGEP
jgi:hypothetical protein